MIRLHPIPDARHDCPHCQVRLEVVSWWMPGMRPLAELKCPKCQRGFYGDLPSGHGFSYPMLLDRQTGETHDVNQVPWFAEVLKSSFRDRKDREVKLVAEEFRPLKRVVLLNCLDSLYGHSLLKLLNAQYHLDHQPELDLVVLIPPFLRWLVPAGCAAIWTAAVPLSQGAAWHEGLAREIKERVSRMAECHLSLALSHPHPMDFQIERFSGIKPFELAQWSESSNQPKLAFVWREDRVWIGKKPKPRGKNLLRWVDGSRNQRREQTRAVIALAENLRQKFPKMEFSVIGLGRAGGLPGWMHDLRHETIDVECERNWCRQYAQTHVLIGVHGSNMLLPSAHAGAVVELVPPDRWGNLVQDILLPPEDSRQALLRMRFLPLETSVRGLADCVSSLVRELPLSLLNFARQTRTGIASENPWHFSEQRRRLAQGASQL